MKTRLEVFRILLGALMCVFGVYIFFSLIRIFHEDIECNFNLLRIAYAWNWQYWVVHIWLYSLLMIVCGVLLLTRKHRNSIGVILTGLLCFFLYTAVFESSILNLFMFVICCYYFYTAFIKGIKSKDVWRFVAINFGWILINGSIIFISRYFAYETFELIQNYFSM